MNPFLMWPNVLPNMDFLAVLAKCQEMNQRQVLSPDFKFCPKIENNSQIASFPPIAMPTLHPSAAFKPNLPKIVSPDTTTCATDVKSFSLKPAKQKSLVKPAKTVHNLSSMKQKVKLCDPHVSSTCALQVSPKTPKATGFPNVNFSSPYSVTALMQPEEKFQQHLELRKILNRPRIEPAPQPPKIFRPIALHLPHQPVEHYSVRKNEITPNQQHEQSFTSELSSPGSGGSSFQDGVTIGYTYDALFVTDGRSKRRRTDSVCTMDFNKR